MIEKTPAAFTTPPAQKRAIEREFSLDLERVPLPYARDRKEVEAEAAALAEHFGLRRNEGVIVTTWLRAHGDSYSFGLDSRIDGHRVTVHTWHATGEICVARSFGSFYRPREGREGVTYAEATIKPSNAGWNVYGNDGFRRTVRRRREAAIRQAIQYVLRFGPEKHVR